MPSYSMETFDLNGDTTSSNATLTKRTYSRGPGCYVSSMMGFVFILLAMVLAVGVGIIVHFAQSRDITCNFGNLEMVESAAIKACQDKIQSGGNAATEICRTCQPSSTVITTTTNALTTTTALTTSITTAATPTYPRNKYRLPRTVVPSHYTLRLQPFIYGNDPKSFYFEGSVTITVTCKEPTNVITLHVDRLDIQPSDVSVQAVGIAPLVSVRNISYEQPPHFYHIHLSTPLTANQDYRIHFARFRGNLSTDGEGLYISSYRDGEKTVYLATTQMEAPYARKTFPCFDEPALKATFDTTLVRRTSNVDRSYLTLSNMPQNRSNVISDWTEDVYERTPVMSTYLLAFIVCDYGYKRDTIRGITYSTWARKNALEYAQRAHEHGLKLFQYFDSHFKPNYSTVINKLDNIAIPDFNSGAMENWGLITYREGLLYKPGVAGASDEDWIAEVIGHEIAHMWFGNIVSPLWWGWLWLNEALASFWDFHSVGEVYPSWRKTDMYIATGLHMVMVADALASSHPMSADVETRQEISSIFDDITYTKGSLIIRMMHFIMGQDKFIEGLNVHLGKKLFSSAEHKDLWNALNEVSMNSMGRIVNMSEVMDPWVTQMGYPVVTVSKTGSGYRLTQKRFLLGSESTTDDRYKNPPYKYQWEIPITFTTDREKNFNKTGSDIFWLHKNQTLDINVNTQVNWVVVNVQQFGYYRVNYDVVIWEALIQQLKTDHTVIHPINRAQIINDAWNLVKGDLLDMSIALKTLDYLSKELDYVPWRAFAREMDYVELMLDRSILYSDLEKFIQDTVSHPLQVLGLNISEGTPLIDIFARIQIADYSCGKGHTTCVNMAKQEFSNWRRSGTNNINPNLRYRFYCTAIQNGGIADWNFVYEKYKAEDDATENSRLRRALACTSEPSLLLRLLTMTFNTSEIRTQDIRTTIQAVAANRWGRDIAYHFVAEHFVALSNVMSAVNMNRLIASVTAHFNSDYHLTQLNNLASGPGVTPFIPAINQARAQTQTNKDWLNKHFNSLETWLKSQGTGPAPGEKINYRLPTNVIPEHYAVRLQPYIYGTDPSKFYFEGSCTITVVCKSVTDTITLHMDRLNISQANISVRAEGSSSELLSDTSYDSKTHFYRLKLSQQLAVNVKYNLTFSHFTGPLTTDGNGLYYSYYPNGSEHVYLATTQMEMIFARKTFPCFDEPAMKATFDIKLVYRRDTGRNYTALSNMNEISQLPLTQPDGTLWIESTFNRSVKMPTYLLAFIICDYKYLENETETEPKIKYRTWARPNAIQWAERAHNYGIQMYHWLDKHFKPPYGAAIPKLDNIAVPDFNFGAMENWGLITYRETLLYQPGVTSASTEYWMGTVIAHEIAHMWFGDYVSPLWWNWLWLNEAFASWWDVYTPNQVFPQWRVVDEWVPASMHGVMATDSLASSHPLTADAESPTEINALFDGITYDKGAAVLRMIHFVMNETNFISGLNRYLDRKKFGNAQTSDLWSALDEEALHSLQINISARMDPWVTQMGLPVVTVTRNGNSFSLTQKRFLIGSLDGTDPRYRDPPYKYQWEIPVVYCTSSNPSYDKTNKDVHWLSKNSTLTIPASTFDEWILVNVQQIGYFRVHYDIENWQAIIRQLNRDHRVFHPLNRGQIINDAWNLVKAGMLNMSIALGTLDFLQSETDYVAWRAFSREFDYVDLMIERTDLYEKLTNFMLETVRTPMSRLTLTITDNMPPIDVFVRTLIARYACTYGHVGCINDAKRLFAQFKNTDVNTINPNLRRQFYCTAVAEGTKSDWEFVYKQFKSNDDSTELTNLRYALSCARDPSLLRKLLTMSLNTSEIRTQDIATTVQWVAANPLGRDFAFQFFVDNYEKFEKSLDVLYLGRTFLSVTSHFNTEYNLQQLQQFSEIRGNAAVGTVLEQAMAQTRSNIAWLKANYDQIKQWLENRVPVTPTPEKKYRLPTDLKPHHYKLQLQPHIYGNDSSKFYFEGSVTITFSCVNTTSIITLHEDRLDIDNSNISVTDTSSNSRVNITKFTKETTYHFYHIHLGTELEIGKTYTVTFPYFRGAMRQSGEGLYLSSYKDGSDTIYLATTQMEATYARQVFPCFDEPAMKATFETTLVRRTDYMNRAYITLSNKPIKNFRTIDSSWTADEFETTMIMPTYLLAFIVCDYRYWSNTIVDPKTNQTIESRTYVRPNRYSEAERAQKFSIEIFEWFNSHFQPPYQTYLSKVDHIAIPDFTAGAMENWGLITYREALLYNSYSRASDLSWIATVISHELAHMWFGNKVSPLWWDWLWLNEAFASYWEYYVVGEIYPSWKLHEVELTASVFSAMQTDSYSTSHPMTNPVESPSEIDNQFDTIAYTKGGAIIAMMHYIMGEHFISALNLYLTKHQTGNAEHKNLLDSLDEYSQSKNLNLSMTTIIEPWILQMGYPVVKVDRINNRGTLRFSQQRFLLGTTTANDTGKFGYKYEIPITYTTDIDKNFNKSRNEIRWLQKSSNYLDIPLTDSNAKWVIVNQRHQGYFRVLYDTDNWLAIINQLNTDHTAIHEINRATIIDDAWNLVKANMLNLSIALQTIDYMKKETDYGPWRTFARELDYMESMIERSELFKDFKRFMQDLVDEPLKKLTLNVPSSNEPPVQIYTQVWVARDACLYEHLTCVNEAKRLVNNWKNGQGNTININLRQDFYCTAIREGDQDVWDFIYKKYQEETVSTEKSLLRNALGCSKDPTVLMTFLDMCLYDDEVPRSETPNCVSAVAANRYGRDVALSFVMENFPMLQKGLPSSLGSMVLTVTAFFHTEFHLSQLQFLTDTYDVSGITSQLERAKQRTLTNIRWLQNNFQIVKEWLARKVRPPPTQISDYRLPKTIVPHHYNLFLQPEIYSTNVNDFKFNGSVEILIECVETTNVVTLHAYSNLEIDDARLEAASGTELETVMSRDTDRQFVMFSVRQNLTVKATYWLKLQFKAKKMISDGVGLYYSSYQDGDQTVYLATTKFEAPYARRAFPCFDEPALKATFNTTLIRRDIYLNRTYRAWSNNDLQGSYHWAGDYWADRFHTTPKTSTYLLAFIVSDFECLSSTIVNVTTGVNVMYRTCARPNAYQFGQLAQDYGVKEFTWLEDHFEPKYIMPKLDNFAIPDFLSGAMENWGLITYREDLLYENKVTTASIKDWIVEVVAHELAHMWFGNIVSPKWWDWLWLNEAFASFWDFHIVEVFEPTWKMTEQFIVQSLHSTMATDSLQSSHPLTADVESPSQIQAIFDSITYNKGAAFVRMMHFILGEGEFIRLLNIYLGNRNYSNAEHQDLWDALDKNNLGLNMTDLMDPWVTQMNYPVVNVTRGAGGQFVLTQSRFLSSASGASDQAPYGYKWDIPITYATDLNPQFNITGSNITWFRKTAPQVILSTNSSVSWILVNIQQYGIYRVNYEEENWKRLIQQLNISHTVIHPINRAQIINDAWSLAKAGQLNMSIALSTIDFLRKDDDYTPWRAMAGELDYLDLMLSNTETYGQFKDYMKSLVNGTFWKLGMKGVENESLIIIFQRQRIVSYACKYGVEECSISAIQQFRDWRDTGMNEIDVDLRSIIYCYGIRYGTDKDWEFALETYKKSSSSSERSNLQSSLACSQQPWLIKRFLDLTLDSSVIRNQDVRAAILSVSSNPIGRQMAWDFFQEHFDRLSTYMTPGNYGSMILSLTAHFNTDFQLKQVEQFVANNEVTSAQSTFRQVIEQTRVNINWMNRYHNLIKDWLKPSV